TEAERLDDELARARLGEYPLEEDLALRHQGQGGGAGPREHSQRVAPLDRGHLPSERVGLLPGELAVRGEGDHRREVERAVERTDDREPGADERVGRVPPA